MISISECPALITINYINEIRGGSCPQDLSVAFALNEIDFLNLQADWWFFYIETLPGKLFLMGFKIFHTATQLF